MSDPTDTPDDDSLEPDDDAEADDTSADADSSEDGGSPAVADFAVSHRPDQTTTMKIEGDTQLRTMMTQYFMEYASYVIKDRAIPDLRDGLKPVQRRILHTLFQIDDGKFHKVANVVGRTMSYHPHGDSSIYAALVNIANKDFFIEKQGNFGNIFTGDNAAAARYIECRLSPLAKEVLFNKEITDYVPSYDGRNQEPVSLPAKLPVLLMQGTEGIAVGMSTRILSHNFNELLDAQIQYLKTPAKPIFLYPDFLQGGIMDVNEYDDGNGKVRLRALIQENGKNTLVIREIPATTNTEQLIASIEDAANKGKLKLSSISDYTAESVEIEIVLTRGSDPERAIKALYAYTDCEVPISCNCLVIRDGRPAVMSVSSMLRYNTDRLRDDLKRELEIELAKLDDQHHAKTLAQIFIENRIYKLIEECTTADTVLAAVHEGLKPFRHLLTRDVVDEDVERLLQIPIRRISLFDINKNRRELQDILDRMAEIRHHLENLTTFTINYLKGLKKKYGHLYPRRTRIDAIEEVSVRDIALKNIKVGHDRGNGFIGTAVKSDDPMTCTEYDRLVIVGYDGVYKVIPIPDKLYVGSVCAIYKADRDQVYSLIYRDKKTKTVYAKRFKVDKYIMDKDYKGIPKGCKVEKLFDRYGVVVRCEFEELKGQKTDHCILDFDEYPLRGATAKGIKVHSRNIVKFLQIKRGTETDPNSPGGGAAAAEAAAEDDGPGIPDAALKLAMPDTDEVAVTTALRAELAPKEAPQRRTAIRATEPEPKKPAPPPAPEPRKPAPEPEAKKPAPAKAAPEPPPAPPKLAAPKADDDDAEPPKKKRPSFLAPSPALDLPPADSKSDANATDKKARKPKSKKADPKTPPTDPDDPDRFTRGADDDFSLE